MKPKAEIVAEILAQLEDCTRLGARFVSVSEQADFYPYCEIVRRARTSAAYLQRLGLKPGENVAIILPTGVDFFDAFLGTQLAGAVPTALYPPFRLGKLDEYFVRLRRMLTRIEARYLITEKRIRRLIGEGVVGVKSLRHVIEASELTSVSGEPACPRGNPDSPAFFQFSSGSTSDPKAVVVSHRNLVGNLAMMQQVLVERDAYEVENGGVCWLPLYHDMGLVGCLYLGLYYPATMTYIGPDLFLSRPALWLRTLSRYKAAISPAPNFAYAYCVNKIRDEELEGVDLSRWRIALNGAEPIDPEGVRSFTERFARWGLPPAAITPVYGLAEAGLGVTFSGVDDPPLVTEFDRDLLATEARGVRGPGRKLVSVGSPLPGIAVEIRNADDTVLPEAAVGRIMIKGPSVTCGYLNDPDATTRSIRDGWLDTGDLGFFLEGQLYIVGRVKDLIIIRGRNFAPQEIEELLLAVPGLRPGCAVALGGFVEGQGEQLIILAERDTRHLRNPEEVIADVRSRVRVGLALRPHHVELLPAGTLPRTSSGKLRRAEALRQFVAGELVPPEKVSALKLLLEMGKSRLAWSRFSSQQR